MNYSCDSPSEAWNYTKKRTASRADFFTFKYNKKNTTKTAETLVSEVTQTLQNYDTNNLQKFDGVFRHSQVTGLIDDTDESILSNITTVKIRKDFTPLIGTSSKYDVYFRNSLYNPHSGHNSASGGILSSTGFKIDGNDNEMFLDDDGQGNVRLYYLSYSVLDQALSGRLFYRFVESIYRFYDLFIVCLSMFFLGGGGGVGGQPNGLTGCNPGALV